MLAAPTPYAAACPASFSVGTLGEQTFEKCLKAAPLIRICFTQWPVHVMDEFETLHYFVFKDRSFLFHECCLDHYQHDSRLFKRILSTMQFLTQEYA